MTLTDSPTRSVWSPRADEAPPDNPAELQAWLDDQIDAVSADMERTLKRIMVEATDLFLASLTAAADTSGLDNAAAAWSAYVEADVAPVMGGLYRQGSLVAWLGANAKTLINSDATSMWAKVVNEDAAIYMQRATNRLVGVGSSMWGNVRRELTAGIMAGRSVEDLKGSVETLMGTTEFRADTIARTEVVGAFVQGDRNGAVALGEWGPVEHYWMATLDNRTREDHAAADGQTVPFDEPFTVGGVSMMAPHDPFAPAEQVVNCRCVEGHLYAGDTRPDGSKVEVAKPEALSLPKPKPPIFGGDDSPRVGNRHEQTMNSGYPDQQAADLTAGWAGDPVDGSLIIRAPQSAMDSILDDGFKTQFETGRSGGMFDPGTRASHEKAMFGTDEHPIYGYVNPLQYGQAPSSDLAYHYGDMQVHLKAEVADRATLTLGDSLNTYDPPAPLRIADVGKAPKKRVAESSAGYGSIRDKWTYVEHQVHGGVKPDDIAYIVYDPSAVSVWPEVRAKIEAKGIRLVTENEAAELWDRAHGHIR